MSTTVLILSNHFITLYAFRRELIAKLVADGYRVVLSMPADERNSFFSALGCEVIETAVARHGINPVADLRLILKYRAVMKVVEPDVVLSFTIKPNIYGSIASRMLGIQHISNITGTGEVFLSESLISKIIRALYRVSIRRDHKVFFQNSSDQAYFASHGLVGNNHELLPGSGVNLEEHPVVDLPPDDVVKFIFVGRVMKIKGIDEYLECARAVREKFRNTRFFVAGFIEDERYRGLIEQSQRAGCVDYIGFRDDLAEWIARCHCTVLPSHGGEGVPNALLESAATGRACIASDIAGARDVVDDGANGFLFQAHSSDDLTRSVIRFVELSFDEKRAMGLAGRRKVEGRFDRERVIDAYLREIRLLGSKPRLRRPMDPGLPNFL